jgi:DnaJ domain
MSKNIDYYHILGVYPGAKADIINLSYQKLRLYLSTINDDNSAQKLNQINEAFLILSNKETRTKYDHSRAEKIHLANNYFDTKLDPQPNNTLLIDNNWSQAINNYPQLYEIEDNLRSISWRLSTAFKLYLLNTKYFDAAKIIASQLEISFLENFFSSDKNLIDFGKMLIIHQEIPAAKELNTLVNYVSEVSEVKEVKEVKEVNEKQTAVKIILRILDKYALNTCNFDNLLINAAMRLEPELVKIYLNAGANANIIIDGNQSLFTCFTKQYGFMRHKGFEEEIKKKYAIDRSFYKYKAKKIDIIEDRKKRIRKEEQRKKYIKKMFLILLLIVLWLIHVNR